MVPGVIIRTASIAERPLAVPVDIAQRITVIIAIPPVHGASTVIPSIDARKPAPAAVHRPMTTPITAILMVRGQERTIRSTNAQKRALLVEIPARNMQTTPTRTVTESATTAARPSVWRSNGTLAQTEVPLTVKPASPRQASRIPQ